MSASSVLTAAGREHLAPLGLRQKGRSRTWLDDQGWWVGVVEFQPSSWSKGSYLNTGVTWLWDNLDHIAFHVFDRVSVHVAYSDDEQFMPEARKLAMSACDRIMQYREMFVTPRTAAEYLAGEAASPANLRHSGLAFGLSGNVDSAHAQLSLFAQLEASRDWEIEQRSDARRLIEVSDPVRLTAEINQRIKACRLALRLPT